MTYRPRTRQTPRNRHIRDVAIKIEGDIALIPLTHGYVAIIDSADIDKVLGRCWQVVRVGRCTYASANYVINGKRTRRLLHRIITESQSHEGIDHIDRDGLNCRKSNLRPATQRQNCHNTGPKTHRSSRFKGVSWSRHRGRWLAKIRIGGIQKNLGRYQTEEEAARAYDRAAKAEFGEFAYVNFPETRP